MVRPGPSRESDARGRGTSSLRSTEPRCRSGQAGSGSDTHHNRDPNVSDHDCLPSVLSKRLFHQTLLCTPAPGARPLNTLSSSPVHLIFRLLSQPPSFCSQAELPQIGGLGSGFRLRPFEAGQRQACHVDVAKARNSYHCHERVGEGVRQQ